MQKSTLWLERINPKRPHHRKINQHGGYVVKCFFLQENLKLMSIIAGELKANVKVKVNVEVNGNYRRRMI